MYRALATPFSAMPASTMPTRAASGSSGSRSSSARNGSMRTPISTTFATVPMPGFCRSGHQASRIRTLSTIVTVPRDQPTCRATPWLSTSHGMLPSPVWTSRAIEAAYRTRPTTSWTPRRPARARAARRDAAGAGAGAAVGCGRAGSGWATGSVASC